MPTLRTTGIAKNKNGRPETAAPPLLARGGMSGPQNLRESSTGSIGSSTPASRRKSVGVQPASATKRPATARRQSNVNAGMAKDRVSCIVRKRPAKASEVRPPTFNADTQQTQTQPRAVRTVPIASRQVAGAVAVRHVVAGQGSGGIFF